MNFAIVGCGIIAVTHANALAQLDGSSLYAVCDILPEKADEFARQYGAQKVYYDHHTLLRDKNIDIVCVCVPSGTHAEICIDSARAGKAIVCEKPMEITPKKMQAIIDAVEETGVKMQCIFQRRMMPNAIAVRECIRQGFLGKICMAEADLKYYRDQAYYNSAGWRGTWAQDGGGALMNQGVHGVDLILWMLDDEIESVYGMAETLARDIEVEDTAAAVLRMKKGALCTIASATSTYPGFSTTFRIFGDKGTVAFNDEGLLLWEFVDPTTAPPPPGTGGDDKVGGHQNPAAIGIAGHIQLLQDIAEAVETDRQPLIPPQDATLAVRVICAIYSSTKSHAEVTV